MSQEKKSVEDVVNMIFNFTKVYPDVDKTIEFIRKNGYELSVGGKNSGAMNTRSLEALMDPRLLNDGGSRAEHRQIRDALVQVEIDRFKDRPANLFRSASLFKLAAEQEMRWALEDNPDLALQYAKDPVGFIAEYELDPGLKAKFKDFLKISEAHAKENDLPFNPAVTVHTLVFSCINGPILKHFDEQSRNEKLSDKARAEARAAYDSLGRGPARALTDSNTVISGAYSGKFQSLTDKRRRDRVVSKKDVQKYLEVLDAKLNEIDPERGVGAILTNAGINQNLKGFGERHDKWRLENRNNMEKARDAFVGFFKDAWKTIKSVFKQSSKPVSIVEPEIEGEIHKNPLHSEAFSADTLEPPKVTKGGQEIDQELYAEPSPEDMITPEEQTKAEKIQPQVDLPPPVGPNDAPEETQQNGALPMDLETTSGAKIGEPDPEPDMLDLQDYAEEGLPTPEDIQRHHEGEKPKEPEGPSETTQAMPEQRSPRGPGKG